MIRIQPGDYDYKYFPVYNGKILSSLYAGTNKIVGWQEESPNSSSGNWMTFSADYDSDIIHGAGYVFCKSPVKKLDFAFSSMAQIESNGDIEGDGDIMYLYLAKFDNFQFASATILYTIVIGVSEFVDSTNFQWHISLYEGEVTYTQDYSNASLVFETYKYGSSSGEIDGSQADDLECVLFEYDETNETLTFSFPGLDVPTLGEDNITTEYTVYNFTEPMQFGIYKTEGYSVTGYLSAMLITDLE